MRDSEISDGAAASAERLPRACLPLYVPAHAPKTDRRRRGMVGGWSEGRRTSPVVFGSVPRQPPSAIRASEESVRRCRRWIARLEALGMTRSAIAQRAGVAPSTVTRLAAGSFAAPSRATVAAVLAVRRR
jgi:hypothetical protein